MLGRRKPVEGAVPLVLVLRIAEHRTLLGEIGHRVITLEGETIVARLRSRAGGERQESNQGTKYQSEAKSFQSHVLFL